MSYRILQIIAFRFQSAQCNGNVLSMNELFQTWMTPTFQISRESRLFIVKQYKKAVLRTKCRRYRDNKTCRTLLPRIEYQKSIQFQGESPEILRHSCAISGSVFVVLVPMKAIYSTRLIGLITPVWWPGLSSSSHTRAQCRRLKNSATDKYKWRADWSRTSVGRYGAAWTGSEQWDAETVFPGVRKCVVRKGIKTTLAASPLDLILEPFQRKFNSHQRSARFLSLRSSPHLSMKFNRTENVPKHSGEHMRKSKTSAWPYCNRRRYVLAHAHPIACGTHHKNRSTIGPYRLIAESLLLHTGTIELARGVVPNVVIDLYHFFVNNDLNFEPRGAVYGSTFATIIASVVGTCWKFLHTLYR